MYGQSTGSSIPKGISPLLIVPPVQSKTSEGAWFTRRPMGACHSHCYTRQDLCPQALSS